MQSDYQILYEVLKEKTLQLEQQWKSILVQLKEATSQGKNSKDNLLSSDSISTTEPCRHSFGRRINPTLLKTESIRIETSAGANPFLSASIENQSDVKEFPLNRPVGKHVTENTAWKKLPSPNVAKVGDCSSPEFGHVKMEYSVYFKQGISIQKQEMLKKISVAFYQIVFDEVTIDFASFTEGFGIILRILTVGHELFSLSTFSKIVTEGFLVQPFSNTEGNNIFETPVELILFSVLWCQSAKERLVQILPDSLKCFEKNLLLHAIDSTLIQYFRDNFRKEEISLKPFSENSAGLSLHSLLPVAYSNQRDSKNFFRDPTSHSNQQKIRDLFLNLIRHFSTNQLDTSHPNFNRSFGSRVSELMSKVNGENYFWLADLYIKEYEQAADVRLDRLEERMTSRRSLNGSSSTTFSLDQIFFMFLQFADSFRLTRAIEKKIIAMISVSLEQANNPHKRPLWSECIRKLRSIIKLLAFCRYKIAEILCDQDEKNGLLSVDEEDILIFSWTQDAILHKQLLSLLPLVYEYFTFIGPNAIKSRCSNTVKLLIRYYQVKFELKRKRSNKTSSGIRAKLFLRLALEDIFRETLSPEFYSECAISMNVLNEEISDGGEEEDENRISKSQNKDNAFFARSIDEDDSLPLAVSSVYKSISSQVRAIYIQLNSICMNFAFNNTLNSAESQGSHRNNDGFSSQTATDSTPRKVRPITQVPAADLKEQKIQKQLRQWFWWRYGSQKDLVDALNSYILEQLLFPQFPLNENRIQSAEICKQMYRELIYKVLPELLPIFWKESPELVEMILSLSLEVAGKIIKHHFS